MTTAGGANRKPKPQMVADDLDDLDDLMGAGGNKEEVFG